MKRKTVAALMRQAEASKRKIAAERDKLRAISEELDAIAAGCNDAVDHIERATSALALLAAALLAMAHDAEARDE